MENTDNQTNLAAAASPVTVLALGGAGCRILAQLASFAGDSLRLFAVDTDRAALDACPVPEENKLLAAADWRGGRGCGGNALDGQRAIARERARIESMIDSCEMLLVLGGLGGGTCSGGAGIILSIGRKLNIPTLFMLSMPFSLEGHSKRRVADETLRTELQELADAMVTLPNDLLFSVLPSTTPLAEAFLLADREFAATAMAMTAVLRQGNLLAANFADLVGVLRRRRCYCSIGAGVAEAADAADGTGRCQIALERMLKSPLLGGVEKLRQADAVVLSLIGGPGLTIGETRQVLEQAETFVNSESKLIAGASADPAFEGRIQLCALTVKFDVVEEIDAVVAAAAERKIRPRRKNTPEVPDGEAEQLKFALDTLSKGIMEKTTPVIWNGEDLDFPTFQRRNIAIDPGKTYNAADLK